jgi:ribosomal protein S21
MSDLVKFLSKILLACLLVIGVGWATYIGVRYYHAEQVAYRWISGLAAKQAAWEKKIAESGLLLELRDRETFIKPTTRRKVKAAQAKSRWKKYLRSQELPKKMY